MGASSPCNGKYFLVGRAKRAPHWGVQSRFCVIYVCMSSIVYGKTIQKIVCYNAWEDLSNPNIRMFKVQFCEFEMKCRL